MSELLDLLRRLDAITDSEWITQPDVKLLVGALPQIVAALEAGERLREALELTRQDGSMLMGLLGYEEEARVPEARRIRIIRDRAFRALAAWDQATGKGK
jgi:hypothetical protein